MLLTIPSWGEVCETHSLRFPVLLFTAQSASLSVAGAGCWPAAFKLSCPICSSNGHTAANCLSKQISQFDCFGCGDCILHELAQRKALIRKPKIKVTNKNLVRKGTYTCAIINRITLLLSVRISVTTVAKPDSSQVQTDNGQWMWIDFVAKGCNSLSLQCTKRLLLWQSLCKNCCFTCTCICTNAADCIQGRLVRMRPRRLTEWQWHLVLREWMSHRCEARGCDNSFCT